MCGQLSVSRPGLIFVQPRAGFQVASVHSIGELSDKFLIPAESSLIPPVLQCVIPEIERELIPREQSDVVQGKILFVRTHSLHLNELVLASIPMSPYWQQTPMLRTWGTAKPSVRTVLPVDPGGISARMSEARRSQSPSTCATFAAGKWRITRIFRASRFSEIASQKMYLSNGCSTATA